MRWNGDRLTLEVTGESHSEWIGAVLTGLPAGLPVPLDEVEALLLRRRPGGSDTASSRQESDLPRWAQGLADGVTTGEPLSVLIRNEDCRPGDYESISHTPRPGHADYTAWLKTGVIPPGGGMYSGRMTAPLTAVGGVCRALLSARGILIGAHIDSIATLPDRPFSAAALTGEELLAPGKKEFPVLDDSRGEAMREAIRSVREEGDSLGGRIECGVLGLPPGTGGALFSGLESCIAPLVFAVPAVRGLQFGLPAMRGSENNDAFCLREGRVRTCTNRSGGILGGGATGMPVLFTVSVKPTPSIGLPQQTVDLAVMEETEIRVGGRHDPCIVPRAVPVIEAVTALGLLDKLLSEGSF